MPKLFDLVKVNTATTGTGTITFGSAFSNSFLTPGEAGCADSDSVRYVLADGDDIEVGEGVIGGSVTTMTRTVVFSKIGGTKGTSKISLSGTAYVYFTAISSDILNPADAAAARDAISAFGVVRIQKFTTSGTYTPDPNLVYAVVEAVGGGGAGGGGAATATSLNGGGGGGSGSYARSILSAVTIGVSQTVTISAGGAGANNADGGSGGDCSFGSLCIGKGGTGGTRGTSAGTVGSGGAGGVVGTGDLTFVGGRGYGSNYASITTMLCQPGHGGPSYFSPGAPRPIVSYNNVANGQNATGYGGGGSGGGAHGTTSTSAGGNGAQGIVLVTEFCSQ